MSLHVEGQPCGELPELQHAHELPRLCAQDFGALATNSSCPAHAYHPGRPGLPLSPASSAFYAWSLSSPPWLGSMISELWLQSACNLGYFSHRRSFHVTRGKHGRALMMKAGRQSHEHADNSFCYSSTYIRFLRFT